MWKTELQRLMEPSILTLYPEKDLKQASLFLFDNTVNHTIYRLLNSNKVKFFCPYSIKNTVNPLAP